MKSGFSEPSALKRRSCSRICAKRGPRGTLLKRVGQIWLVSILASASGTAMPDRTENASMLFPRSEFAHVDQMAAQRRGRGHRRAHQMSASAGTLAALEVPVRGRAAAFAGLELIAVERGA